jgi:hypothetical protein
MKMKSVLSESVPSAHGQGYRGSAWQRTKRSPHDGALKKDGWRLHHTERGKGHTKFFYHHPNEKSAHDTATKLGFKKTGEQDHPVGKIHVYSHSDSSEMSQHVSNSGRHDMLVHKVSAESAKKIPRTYG